MSRWGDTWAQLEPICYQRVFSLGDASNAQKLGLSLVFYWEPSGLLPGYSFRYSHGRCLGYLGSSTRQVSQIFGEAVASVSLLYSILEIT